MGNYSTRELQQRTLQILLTVDRVCRDHGLTYYISDGTMLGAVRHGGFIPWDDDMDICMPRPDFERLLAHAPEWLPAPFEQVCVERDPYCACNFMKIIDGSTTLIERWSFNQLGGVYMDVFPIDGVASVKWRRKLRFRLYRTVDRWIYMRNRDPYKRGRGYTSWIPRLLQATTTNAGLHRLLRRIQTAHPYESSALVADFDSGERSVTRKEVFGIPTPVNFEGHELLGVEHPHEYLSHLYGDYMQLPPENKRRIHNFDYVDLEHSYHDYHDTRQFK
jgi:lipopolysaccharide cholinephosphotransferase